MNSHSAQGSVFKETQGCFGLLSGMQSRELAGMSSAWPSPLPNSPRKNFRAANCSRKLPVVHHRHICASHLIPATCPAQLSSLSPHLLPETDDSCSLSRHSHLFALGSCTQGKMPFLLPELAFVSPEGKAGTQSHLQLPGQSWNSFSCCGAGTKGSPRHRLPGGSRSKMCLGWTQQSICKGRNNRKSRWNMHLKKQKTHLQR